MVFSMMNEHISLRIKRMRKQCSPWLNESISNLMKERDKVKKRKLLLSKVMSYGLSIAFKK